MPNRIIREGILTSERVDQLNHFAEVFYRRLMSVVDDYGRFSAHPSLLRAAIFPLRVDKVREADITRLLADVQQAGLIALYAVGSKQYLELTDFRQQRRSPSKYPGPDDATQLIPTEKQLKSSDIICAQVKSIDSKCQQVISNAHSGVFVFECEDEVGGGGGDVFENGGPKAEKKPSPQDEIDSKQQDEDPAELEAARLMGSTWESPEFEKFISISPRSVVRKRAGIAYQASVPRVLLQLRRDNPTATAKHAHEFLLQKFRQWAESPVGSTPPQPDSPDYRSEVHRWLENEEWNNSPDRLRFGGNMEFTARASPRKTKPDTSEIDEFFSAIKAKK